MKRLMVSLAALGFIVGIAVADASDAANADVAELTRLWCEMGRAHASIDLAALDRLNADDYVRSDT